MLKKKKPEKLYLAKHAFLIIFLLTTLLLILPHAFRSIDGNDELVGHDSYYHARIADDLLTTGSVESDDLILSGRPVITNPYHLLLSNVAYFTGIVKASKYLSLVLGILSLILLFSMLKRLNLDPMKIFLILFVFVLSPAFIYSSTFSSPHIFAFFLAILGFNLFMTGRKSFFFLSILSFLLIPYFSLLLSLIILLLIFSVSLYKKSKMNRFIILLIAMISSTSFLFFTQYYAYGFPDQTVLVQEDPLTLYISSLGGLVGFDVFLILLALIGFFVTWRSKKRFISLYISLILLIISARIFGSHFNLYSTLILSFFAGTAILKLIRMEWRIKVIKKLTIAVLIYGFLFTGLAYINRISDFPPNPELLSGMEFLGGISEPGNLIFSHHSYGHWIEFTSERVVLLDGSPAYVKDLETRYNDSLWLFSSKDLETTRNLLFKYDIDYIFIDNVMKEGLVWLEQDEGLLFLLRNNETFKNVYNQTGVEIWQVTVEPDDFI